VVRFGLSLEEQEAVWVLWRSGLSLPKVARELGHSYGRVRGYVVSLGGVRPVARRRAAICLSAAEREEISRALARGLSCRQIAAGVGRAASTISREVARNGGPRAYRAGVADRAAWQRARRPKVCKLAADPVLRAAVQAGLVLRWSPRQISGWLVDEYPDDARMRVSPETIYLSLFVQGRGALRVELAQALRSGRTTRRPVGKAPANGQGSLSGKVMISERPAEIEDRAVPGHWEGDLLMGRGHTAIATLVERSTRYVQLVRLPDGNRAGPVREALQASIATLPVQLCRSLTWDQGKEMAEHAQLQIDSGLQIYFCDPGKPWQRGSVRRSVCGPW
jgi:IS30 family transposase